MLDEYLALGGVELGNNARAFAYAQCMSCCAGLLKGPVCEGIHDATNPYTPAVWDTEVDPPVLVTPAESEEPAYDCEYINRAPWYDPDLEVSQRFAGSFLLSVEGATDSTLTAPVVEALGDGGVVGAQRNASRSVRVRTMLVGCGMDAAEYGLAWLKSALSTGFCGRHGDACGTSDLAFFIDCPRGLDAGDTEYEDVVRPLRRYLHGVACTSGAVVAEQYALPSGAYVIIVDFVLTAESPYVWHETIPVDASDTVLTAFDDIPFNLMRYPSAEESDGISQLIATNYAQNGSVEYGTTGWGTGITGGPAGVTSSGAQSTDIAAVGAHSYRGLYEATTAQTNITLYLRYDVDLASLPSGAAPSVSLWGRVEPASGSPTIHRVYGRMDWRDSVPATIDAQEIGDFTDFDGQNLLANGLPIPAGAVTGRIVIRALVTMPAGSSVRIYGDAFALTVP